MIPSGNKAQQYSYYCIELRYDSLGNKAQQYSYYEYRSYDTLGNKAQQYHTMVCCALFPRVS